MEANGNVSSQVEHRKFCDWLALLNIGGYTAGNAATLARFVQAKYVGTGHPETTKHQWLVNQHRDTYSSIIGHPNLLAHVAVAENESLERTRVKLLQKMIQPCGPPPESDLE
ncbi:hypothetical protein H4R35_000107 [Dimargaris xerosporica]|nr:hypothetical protein H4R35_000107 [Dimargaris xerosporica]